MAAALAAIHCVGGLVIIILVVALVVSARFRMDVAIGLVVLIAIGAGLYFSGVGSPFSYRPRLRARALL